MKRTTKQFLLRMLLAATLFCGYFGTDVVAMARHAARDCTEKTAQVGRKDNLLKGVAEEPRSPGGTMFCSLMPSHSVASHRTVRLIPTHGGKPNNKSGRWATVSLSHLNKYLPHGLFPVRTEQCMGFASPRHYFVIALRRILC